MNTVLALAGPTASGKTSAALSFAAIQARRGVQVEIISVDSALVYRGMDVGTAKPSPQEQAAVPHHLIDILDPEESYSAARFVQDARACIADIHARGGIPLLVGGTMLYFKALMDGMDAVPPTDDSVRQHWQQELQRSGVQALHDRLMQVDPITASRLPTTDTQRITRALEVHSITGQPLSSFHTKARTRSSPPHSSNPHARPSDPTYRMISLEPTDRAWLHERIRQRFEQMLSQGLIDEVLALRQRPSIHADLPSMRCVGYRQVWEALDQGLSEEKLVDCVMDRGVIATRQLAKRQITWLRSMPQRCVVAADAEQCLTEVLSALSQAATVDAWPVD